MPLSPRTHSVNHGVDAHPHGADAHPHAVDAHPHGADAHLRQRRGSQDDPQIQCAAHGAVFRHHSTAHLEHSHTMPDAHARGADGHHKGPHGRHDAAAEHEALVHEIAELRATAAAERAKFVVTQAERAIAVAALKKEEAAERQVLAAVRKARRDAEAPPCANCPPARSGFAASFHS
jgi:hypothetical protein